MTPIFDKSNKKIGFLVETSFQIQIFNNQARLLGYYNKQTDLTYKGASYYGKGNQVMALLYN